MYVDGLKQMTLTFSAPSEAQRRNRGTGIPILLELYSELKICTKISEKNHIWVVFNETFLSCMFITKTKCDSLLNIAMYVDKTQEMVHTFFARYCQPQNFQNPIIVLSF